MAFAIGGKHRRLHAENTKGLHRRGDRVSNLLISYLRAAPGERIQFAISQHGSTRMAATLNGIPAHRGALKLGVNDAVALVINIVPHDLYLRVHSRCIPWGHQFRDKQAINIFDILGAWRDLARHKKRQTLSPSIVTSGEATRTALHRRAGGPERQARRRRRNARLVYNRKHIARDDPRGRILKLDDQAVVLLEQRRKTIHIPNLRQSVRAQDTIHNLPPTGALRGRRRRRGHVAGDCCRGERCEAQRAPPRNRGRTGRAAHGHCGGTDEGHRAGDRDAAGARVAGRTRDECSANDDWQLVITEILCHVRREARTLDRLLLATYSGPDTEIFRKSFLIRLSFNFFIYEHCFY